MNTKACAVWLAGLLCCASAAAADAPVETFVFVGERISIEEAPDPCEEAFRKTGDDKALREAFQAALAKLEKDGWYEKLMTSWGMEDASLPEFPINSGKSING